LVFSAKILYSRITTTTGGGTDGGVSWKTSIDDVLHIKADEYAIPKAVPTPKRSMLKLHDAMQPSPRRNMLKLHKEGSTSKKLKSGSFLSKDGDQTDFYNAALQCNDPDKKMSAADNFKDPNQGWAPGVSAADNFMDSLHIQMEGEANNATFQVPNRGGQYTALENAQAYLQAKQKMTKLEENIGQPSIRHTGLKTESKRARKWVSPLAGYQIRQNLPNTSQSARESESSRQLRKTGIRSMVTGSSISR
jgi:hypothetical protein